MTGRRKPPIVKRGLAPFGGKSQIVNLLALALVVGLSLFGRLWQNGTVPGGLHYDEAADGLIGQSILHGHWRIFYPEFSGKEPLYMLVLGLGQVIWGETTQAVRLPAAFVGAATIAASWWAFYALFRSVESQSRARRFAWLAALGLGVSYWHFHLSRLGYRAISLPLVELLAFAALWTAIRTRRFDWWVAAGLLNALILYTYLSARFAPLVLVAFGLYGLVFHRKQFLDYFKEQRRAVLVGAGVYLAGVAPMALYFVFNRRDFFDRANQVSIFQPLGEFPGKLFNSLGQVAQLISLRGSDDLKYNLPGRALFDWPLALFVYGGLLLAIWRWRRPVYGFLLIWLGVMLLPALLTTEANQPLRLGGAVPALFGLWAVGAVESWQWLSQKAKWGRWVGAVGLAGLLLFASVSTWQGYFDNWGKRPDLYYAFDQDYIDFARLTVADGRQQPGVVPVVVTESVLHPTMVFLEPTLKEARWLDLNRSLILPRELFEQNPPPAVDYFAGVRYLQNFKLPTFWEEWLRPNQLRVLPLAGYGGPGGAVYRYQPTKTLTLSDLPIQVRTCGDLNFDDNIRLLGYRMRQEGRNLQIDLFWQAQRATPDDFRMFVHLVGQAGSPDVLGIGDGNGAYSQAWRRGDVIIGHHEISLEPKVTLPGRYLLEVGLYNTTTLKRMPIRPLAASTAANCAPTLQSDPANSQALLPNFDLK